MRALASTFFWHARRVLVEQRFSRRAGSSTSNTDDHFGINFPVEPAIETFSYDSEFGAVFPGRRYSAEVGANRYVLSVVDFTDSQAIHAAIEKTEAAGGLQQLALRSTRIGRACRQRVSRARR